MNGRFAATSRRVRECMGRCPVPLSKAAILRAVGGRATYVRDAVDDLVSTGILIKDPNTGRFSLSPAHDAPAEWEKEHDTAPFIPVDISDFDARPTPQSLQTWVVWPDCHIPFEDKRAYNLVLKVERALKPYGRILIGDYADMLATSRHPKTPLQMRWQLKDEVGEVNRRLDELGMLEANHWCLGNHDINGQRFAAREKAGLYDSLDPRELFQLKGRGWRVHDYQVPVRIGKVWFVHDTDYCGPDAAKQNGALFQASTVQGHVHTAQTLYTGNMLGEHHVSATIGWLGDFEAAQYMAAAKKRRNWQHAFGLMRVEETTQNSHFQVIPIIDGRCCVDGVLYE